MHGCLLVKRIVIVIIIIVYYAKWQQIIKYNTQNAHKHTQIKNEKCIFFFCMCRVIRGVAVQLWQHVVYNDVFTDGTEFPPEDAAWGLGVLPFTATFARAAVEWAENSKSWVHTYQRCIAYYCLISWCRKIMSVCAAVVMIQRENISKYCLSQSTKCLVMLY